MKSIGNIGTIGNAGTKGNIYIVPFVLKLLMRGAFGGFLITEDWNKVQTEKLRVIGIEETNI